jgi:hypothetical protein
MGISTQDDHILALCLSLVTPDLHRIHHQPVSLCWIDLNAGFDWRPEFLTPLPLTVGLTPTGVQRPETRSLAARLIPRPDGGRQPTHGCGPRRAAHIKGRRGAGGSGDRVQRIQYPLPHLVLSPIAKAQQRRDSSTPLRLTGLHQIRCCSCSFDSTPADLLSLHRRVQLRRLHRCRVHRTSPPVRHTNPRSLRLPISCSRFRPTRHCPNRSLSTILS